MKTTRAARVLRTFVLCICVGLVSSLAADTSSEEAHPAGRVQSDRDGAFNVSIGAPGTGPETSLASTTTTSASGAITFVTNFGLNANNFNSYAPANTSVWRGCWGWCGLGTAAGTFDPIGVVVAAATAFGFAVAQADQPLGVRYFTKAPVGVNTSVSIAASVYTVIEQGGISAGGASCGPAWVYEQDSAGIHSNELESCWSSLSLSFPDIEMDAQTAAEQELKNDVNILKGEQTIKDFLGALPTYYTSSFTWSGAVSGGGSNVDLYLDPKVAAADSGGGTEINVSKNYLWVTVTETYNATYTYSGSWFGSNRSLTLNPNVTVESLPDATLLTQHLVNFQTSDPNYSCLNGQTLNVFTAPKEFPNQYVVHDGLQGTMCAYGTWTIPQTYSGTWVGTPNTPLNRHSNVTVENYADSKLVGLLSNFQTTDPNYACLNGASVNVFTAPSEFPGQYVVHDGLQGSMCVYGTWLIPQTYTGTWLGGSIFISPRANVTVESYPDARVIGQVTNFQTTDPSVSCLNGQSINVFSAPNELPGLYVVHDGLQGTMCAYGTWTIPQSYTGTWLGKPASLDLHANVTVEGYADAILVGQIANFHTTDPTYNCLTGASINVFKAPAEFPGQLVVHDGSQGSMCVYGTWTFPITYAANWQSHASNLALVPYASVAGYGDASLVGQVTNLQTDDPAYSCLNGSTLNVYNAPAEYPGRYVVNNGAQSGQCVFGTWTFPKTYSGAWQSVTRFLTPHANVAIGNFSDASLLGQLNNFQSNDLAFSCMAGLSPNVYQAPKEFPGTLVVNNAAQGQCVTGTWTFHLPYSATWQSTATALFGHANVSIAGYSDAVKQGQVTNFQTDDPSLKCLNGSALDVYTAPAEFPNQFVANNGKQLSQCVLGTWTFPETYSGGWGASTVPISLTANVTVEMYHDATLVGQLGNFQTNDPRYSCLNGQAINVFTAPKEFPNQYVVHDGLQGTMCVYGTWTFPQTWYAGTWQGQLVPLATKRNVSVYKYSDATLVGQVTGFQTNDPTYSCLSGSAIDVWTAPKEFAGVYAAQNGAQANQCVYGTWTFAQGWGPTN